MTKYGYSVRPATVMNLAALLIIVGTYWTIEVFYAWQKAWGDSHLDIWYSILSYLGIGCAAFLYLQLVLVSDKK